MLAGGEGCAGQPPPNRPAHPFSPRLKPIQKMEGMTNGVAVGPQQATGLSDISAQVQQYQQFLGESPLAYGPGPGAGSVVPDGSLALSDLICRCTWGTLP